MPLAAPKGAGDPYLAEIPRCTGSDGRFRPCLAPWAPGATQLSGVRGARSQRRGHRRGLAEKLNQGLKDWEGNEEAGGRAHTRSPAAPLIPAPPRHRDCLRASTAGGFPPLEDESSSRNLYAAIPIQTLIKRIIPGCVQSPEQSGAGLHVGVSEGRSSCPPLAVLWCTQPHVRESPNLRLET